MKVLLVEDEEFIRDLFKRQLDLSGFATDAFANGQDGLAAISKNAYDLVLLDIMLPDINGLQILQNIRQNPATKGVAVVLLTNLGQDAVIKQGFELGADGYLVKAAYTPDQIVQEVKNIMAKRTPQAHATPPAPVPMQAPAPAPDPIASSPTSAEPTAPAFPGQAPVQTDPTPMFASPAPVAPTPDPMTSPPVPEPTMAPPAMTPPSASIDPLATPPQFATPPSAAEIAGVAASGEQPVPETPAAEVISNNS
jgi:CheY-like chemotaxis protein